MITSGILGALVVLIGILHMPFARSLLMQVGGCPIERDPSVIEQAQRAAALSRRGTAPAPTHTARGFRLGQDGPSEIESWASTNGVSCSSEREGTWLRCSDVPGADVGMLGTLAHVDFTFRTSDHRLVSVSTYQEDPDASHEGVVFSDAASDLESAFGQPSFRGGDASGSELYATATLEYRYSDLLVDLTTTRLPSQGAAVFQSFVLATD